MNQYKTLSALSGLFRVLGFLGIFFSLLFFVLTILGSTSGWISAVAQTISGLFGSLVLLGLSNLFAATLEIVSNLRIQKDSITRMEVKVNNLQPPA